MTAAVRYLDGFEALVNGVKAYFAATGGGTTVLCGYRERSRNLNQGTGGANRVVFLPGDPNGAGGKITPPRDVGHQVLVDTEGNPVADVRPIASWDRQFSVAIWAADATQIRDELAQCVAATALLERTAQAVEQVSHAGGPNVAWGPIAWTIQQDNPYGAELVVGLLFTHPLMDAPAEVGTPGFTLTRVDDADE